MTSPGTSLFVYGTLLNAEILECLLGYLPERSTAKVNGFQRLAVRDDVFPAVRPSSEFSVEGLLLTDLSGQDVRRLDEFEGEFYSRADAIAETNLGASACQLYVLKEAYYHWLDVVDWSNEEFRRNVLDDYLMMIRPPAP